MVEFATFTERADMRASGRGEQVVVLLNVDSHFRIWSLPEGAQDAIAQRFPRVKILRATDGASLRAGLAEADVLYAWHLSKELFSLARRLKWIHTPAAGVEHFLHAPLRHSDVVLTNSRGLAGDAMADHVFAMMLALARRLPESLRLQAQERWRQDLFWNTPPAPFSLSGKVLGIVGLGGVGLELARRARAFGMKIVATRRTAAKAPRFVAKLLEPGQLPELLAESDFVVIAAPLTQETRGLIGIRELKRMKPTAYLINVGRGEHVHEGALIRALRGQWIAGAALDVFQHEPLPKNSVLWRVPGLLITPHYAGTYPEHLARATDLFIQNLAVFLSGKMKKLRNVVDKQRGY